LGDGAVFGGVSGTIRKKFFFEKKNQKTFVRLMRSFGDVPWVGFSLPLQDDPVG
jgi:hypothetical protein